MMKYAESVSVGTPSPTPKRMAIKADIHHETNPVGPVSSPGRRSPQLRISPGKSPKVQPLSQPREGDTNCPQMIPETITVLIVSGIEIFQYHN